MVLANKFVPEQRAEVAFTLLLLELCGIELRQAGQTSVIRLSNRRTAVAEKFLSMKQSETVGDVATKFFPQ